MSITFHALQYIAEVAKTGSISRAAENLYLSQPHLSNTIRAVEQEYGITLFGRTPRGMELTEAGKAFVRQADSILRQVDALDETFRVDASKRLSLRISLTRSYQVLRAISDFINENDGKPRFQLVIRETNPFRVLEDVRSGRADVGFLHFYENQQEYFQHCMRTYHLRSISSYRRRFLLAMSTDNPLARVPHIERAMLSEQIAVLYGDYESQMAPYANAQESFLGMEKRICVYDRSTAMDLLCRCPNTYTLITGLHPVTLSQYGLVLRECSDWEIYNIGCGIYPADVKLSAEMEQLIQKVVSIDWTERVSG